MKTVMAMLFCLSLFAVGCSPKPEPAKTPEPSSTAPGDAEKTPDTKGEAGGSGY